MEFLGFRRRFAVTALLLHLILLIFLSPVHCDDQEEDHLLQGINAFRQNANVQPLAKHEKANCVADELAERLEDRSCPTNSTTQPTQSQIVSEYPSVFRKCEVDVNSTSAGMIIPVCVPHRVATLVLTNFTQSPNSRYLNDSRYTGVGIGTEEDWTVLVLATNAPGGSFANGAGVGRIVGFGQYVGCMSFLLLLVALIY